MKYALNEMLIKLIIAIFINNSNINIVGNLKCWQLYYAYGKSLKKKIEYSKSKYNTLKIPLFWVVFFNKFLLFKWKPKY